MNNHPILNFAAGPTKLPLEVLKRAQQELLSYQNVGYSILEMSHRAPEFTKIANTAETLLRELLNIPDNYKVLFLQGGATGQFSAIPLNLINRKPEGKADYFITGTWSAKAASEAKKYGKVNEVLQKTKSFTSIPESSEWALDPEASYVYYCANETIHGVEFPEVLNSLPNVPIVCDMSSNILSRNIPVSKFGLIFASAQKNVGCAGLTIVIIRDDLLNYALPQTPTVFNYKSQEGMNSLYNTPPVFSIYIAMLLLEWLKDQGGLDNIEELNRLKSKLLYDFIDESNGFFNCPVDKKYRSLVNIVFRIKDGDEDLENSFVKFAKSKYNIIEIKGHRSVGGLRISMYNAIPLESVEVLIECMKEFQQQTIGKSQLND